MRNTDIAIVGAGLAGSLAATMLGRAGYSVAIIDPFKTARPDFRCEKLEAPHVDSLRRAGVLDEILPSAFRYENVGVARRGRLVEIKPIVEYGVEYGALVNSVRDLIPADVDFVHGKVVDIQVGSERPIVTLAGGEQIAPRLVIGATGLGNLFHTVGMRRHVISANHSLSIAFDVEPADLPFSSLTYYGEHPSDRVAYITMFPLPSGLRVNMFVYRDLSDPWVRRLRSEPLDAIAEILPNLMQLTGRLKVCSDVKVRPIELIATRDIRQPGIVLVGDAFSTACPISGTGASKTLLDVERLCNFYVPAWLETPGISAEKIQTFYRDRAKRRSDAHSMRTSLFAKRMVLGGTVFDSAMRWTYFAGAIGRNVLARISDHRASPELSERQ